MTQLQPSVPSIGPPPRELPPGEDGIPIGRYLNRVCWYPVGDGSLFLHDPERPDRLMWQL